MNKTTLAALIAVIGLAVFGFAQFTTVGTLRAQLAAIDKKAKDAAAEAEARRAELDALKNSLAGFQSEAESLRRQIEDAKKTASTKPADPAAKPGDPKKELNPMLKGIARMFKEPAMREMMRNGAGQGVKFMYGGLAQDLGLSDAEAEPIVKVLGERQSALTDKVLGALGEEGVSLDAIGRTATETRAQYDSQLRQMLGDERFAALQNYERTTPDRMQIGQIESQLSEAGFPLSEAQKQSLLSVMKEERLKLPADILAPSNSDVSAQIQFFQKEGAVEQLMAQEEQRQSAIGNRAGDVGLSPDQKGALDAAFAKQRKDGERMLKMGQAFLGIGSGSTGK